MTIRSRRVAALTAALTIAVASAAPAEGPPKSQLELLVAMELPAYVRGVDVSDLSQSQLATIYSIMHSSRSTSSKNAMIRSALGGRYSLRGLLFN